MRNLIENVRFIPQMLIDSIFWFWIFKINANTMRNWIENVRFIPQKLNYSFSCIEFSKSILIQSEIELKMCDLSLNNWFIWFTHLQIWNKYKNYQKLNWKCSINPSKFDWFDFLFLNFRNKFKYNQKFNWKSSIYHSKVDWEEFVFWILKINSNTIRNWIENVRFFPQQWID
jgi:hypothetical protein